MMLRARMLVAASLAMTIALVAPARADEGSGITTPAATPATPPAATAQSKAGATTEPAATPAQQPSDAQPAQSTTDDAGRQKDSRMCEQLQIVGRYLKHYCQHNGYPGCKGREDELKRVVIDIELLIPDNPYKLRGTFNPLTDNPLADTGNEDPSEILATRVMLVEQAADDIQKCSKEPPSDWQDEPGRIRILGCDKGPFCIWGAGSDRKPVKDPGTGSLALVTGTLGTPEEQDALIPAGVASGEKGAKGKTSKKAAGGKGGKKNSAGGGGGSIKAPSLAKSSSKPKTSSAKSSTSGKSSSSSSTASSSTTTTKTTTTKTSKSTSSSSSSGAASSSTTKSATTTATPTTTKVNATTVSAPAVTNPLPGTTQPSSTNISLPATTNSVGAVVAPTAAVTKPSSAATITTVRANSVPAAGAKANSEWKTKHPEPSVGPATTSGPSSTATTSTARDWRKRSEPGESNANGGSSNSTAQSSASILPASESANHSSPSATPSKFKP